MNRHNPTRSKKEMLQALRKSLGIVSTASEIAGIHRSMHYAWMKEDEEYKREAERIREHVLDFAESHLFKLIEEGNVSATIFFLKTRGKARGYTERQELQIQERKPLSWIGGEGLSNRPGEF